MTHQDSMESSAAAPNEAATGFSTYNEKPLHAALKAWYARPGDHFEVPVDGFVIDIVRGRLLVEIQTGNFSALKRKLGQLVGRHPVRLVYPVACEKWLVKLDGDGEPNLGRRKSPKRGTYEQVFEELVSFPGLVCDPNFSLEVVLIREEETRRRDGSRAWRRRGWVTDERRLLEVVDSRRFETPADLLALVPSMPAGPFTTSDLARAMSRPTRFARKVAYCLRGMGTIEPVGKQGNAILYVEAPSQHRA